MAHGQPPQRAQPDNAGSHASPELTDTQRLDWLQLIRSENIGPGTFRDLINHFGSARDALDALPDLAHRGGRAKRIRVVRREVVEAELEAARGLGAHVVVCGEPGYPRWLCEIDAPPPVLFVMGRLELADARIVAIVGSRRCSAAGRKMARTLARDLGAHGFVVSSGLARGIDGEAHRAAFETGTIAVVAGGIDVIYPPEHDQLHRDIACDGLLVSENPPGQPPRGQDFPRRNRIISGMSEGVLVIEAAERSGSLITARLANEQGRQVFALPGNPLDPRASGTNKLLKEGATLITRATDVVEQLSPLDPRVPPRVALPRQGGLFDGEAVASSLTSNGSESAPQSPDGSERQRIIDALGTTPIEVDELCRTSALPARVVQVTLLELELAGRLERHNNQLVSLKPERSE